MKLLTILALLSFEPKLNNGTLKSPIRRENSEMFLRLQFLCSAPVHSDSNTVSLELFHQKGKFTRLNTQF